MLINRTFVLACTSAVTLGIAAASSTPALARCSDTDSFRYERSCLIGSIVSRVRNAVDENGPPPKPRSYRDNSTARSSGNSTTANSTASSADTKPSGASASTTCGLTKQYVNGAVTFSDTCTGEWAQQGR